MIKPKLLRDEELAEIREDAEALWTSSNPGVDPLAYTTPYAEEDEEAE